MVCHTTGCLGKYDFDHIVSFARKKFIDKLDTITLLQQAKSDREREEIALVAMLDIKDDEIKDIQLCCKYSDLCSITTCREKLKRKLEKTMQIPSTIEIV